MAIVTLTLNPAIDWETRAPALTPGHKLRCDAPRRDPGGGGINVARAIRILGGSALAAVAVGGPAGAGLAALLRDRGIAAAELPAPGETRQNLSVIETATGAQYRFIFPGPTWTDADMDAAADALRALVGPGDLVVLSGSLPPGGEPARFVELARGLRGLGARVVADTSGPALAALASAACGIAMLRMNSDEARQLTGRDLTTRRDSVRTAQGLVAAGAAEIVILARKAEGSILATASECWFAPAVEVPVACLTGAGDSFVAGAVLAMARGAPASEILQWGCAAASAAVTTPAAELCDRAMFETLLPQSAARPV